MMDQEISAMKSGKELDKAVAKEVMGHLVVKDELLGDMERFEEVNGGFVWGPVQSYSEDISLAESIIDKMNEQGYEDIKYRENLGSGENAEAEAICKASLMAVIKRRRTDKLLREALGEAEES